MRFGKPAVDLLSRELNYLEKNKITIENAEEEKNLHFDKITFNKVSYKLDELIELNKKNQCGINGGLKHTLYSVSHVIRPYPCF